MFHLSRIRTSTAIVPPAESDPTSSGILLRLVSEDLSVSESHTQKGQAYAITLTDVIDPGWAYELEPIGQHIHAMDDFLRSESAAGRGCFPADDRVLRAFSYPFDAMRVLIVGQDPYPTPGHPAGLSFFIDPSVRPILRSLVNIYKELYDDPGISPADDGDLTPWCERGMMFLNRVLTVQPGKPASHRGKGREEVTTRVIRRLAGRDGPLVAILWDRSTQELKSLLGNVPTIESPYPSPLSATRSFFGSRPFSRANALLADLGGHSVDWSLRQANWSLRWANWLLRQSPAPRLPQRDNDGAREAQRESPTPHLPQCIRSGNKARSRRSVHVRCEAGSPITVAASFRSGKESAPGYLPSNRPFEGSLRRKAGPSVTDDERARLQDRRKPIPMRATAGAAKGCGHRSRLLRRVPHRYRFVEPVRDFQLVIQS